MKLDFSPNCKTCMKCFSRCPVSRSADILRCNHCNTCVAACPRDAFVEVTKGVYRIEQKKCNLCMKCLEACDKYAIVFENRALKKCDLCEGKPKCIGLCKKGRISLDCGDSSAVLGWTKINGEYDPNIAELSELEARAINEIAAEAKERPQPITRALDAYCKSNGIALSDGQRSKLASVIKSEVEGYSIFDCFLADDSLEEIVVNGTHQPIMVYKRGKGWLKSSAQFTDSRKLVDIVNKMSRCVGRRITSHDPAINATLPDGSRLHAIMPPLAKEADVTIRKFRVKQFSFSEISDTMPYDALAFLWEQVMADSNIIIAGSTGSGKTTTLNTLASFIPLDERVVVVEETPEIRIPHRHKVSLVVNQDLKYTMNDLVTQTLRMRPDKLIVGEVRTSDELRALFNTMLAGQGKGSLATFHATSAEEALIRMQSMGIPNYDLCAIDVIVVQKRWKKDGREIRRVVQVSDGKKDLFSYNGRSIIPKITLKKSTRARAKFLSRLKGGFDDNVEQICSYRA